MIRTEYSELRRDRVAGSGSSTVPTRARTEEERASGAKRFGAARGQLPRYPPWLRAQRRGQYFAVHPVPQPGRQQELPWAGAGRLADRRRLNSRGGEGEGGGSRHRYCYGLETVRTRPRQR
jgi:hypothetical protein